MGRWKRTLWWSLGLSVVLAGTIVWSVTVGPVNVPAATVIQAILNAVAIPAAVTIDPETSAPIAHVPWIGIDVGFIHPFSFSVPRAKQIIVAQIRLPRIVLAAIVGFTLSTAGTVMQGLFRNPMADPSIIGVSSGAAVGAVMVLVFGVSVPFGLQGVAFLAALITAFAVYLIATTNGRTPVETLLLAGVAVQTFLGAVVSYLLLQAGKSVNTVLHWLMGDLAAAGWDDVTGTLVLSLCSFAILIVFAQDLNVLLLGEEQAQTVGIDVERTKRVLLAVASLATAAAVSVAGVIGFVGLIVPHMLRLLVGPDHRVLLPTSAIAGAIFLVGTDTVARGGATQLPVGIVTAALGAPFFLYLLRRREVHQL
ncbi:vitamin B12 ABC transporter permease BtuC [Halocatena pleomorpha]|uniref:Cobalamin ABC transporter permease BtuC n=1 Tax=Halocatena pleomorpha TaxID=1785090 RepID=A0A3P3RCU9_9EURY|nr:vitamin B12 ABC transporter permease BtuC [Halocatena pleomorpha]RRJ30530.1 cobalamin ABC transporter permease BtuC [Halocatena pleomorpha]